MDRNNPAAPKGFVTRHAKVVAFMGALIVFSTFIVKEGIRERLKSITDSADEAEGVFLIRSDTNELPIYMAYLNLRLGTLERLATGGAKPGAVPTLNQMRETVDLMRANMERANTSVENLDLVFEKLGSDEVIQGKLEEVKTQVGLWNSRKETVNSHAIELNSQNSNDATKINQVISKAEEVNGGYTSLRFDKVVPLSKNMRELAEEKRKKYEQFYKQATWLSYILYVFGWGLGLVGKIYGLDPGELV